MQCPYVDYDYDCVEIEEDENMFCSDCLLWIDEEGSENND